MIELRRSGAHDVRFAPPVGVAWAVCAVLVGTPAAAVPVAVAAAGGCGAALIVVMATRASSASVSARATRARASACLRAVAGPVFVALVLVATLGMLIAVGEERRAPAWLVEAGGGRSEVVVRLDRDLPAGTRSVAATLRSVDGRAVTTTVPVRFVPTTWSGSWSASSASSMSASSSATSSVVAAGSVVRVSASVEVEPAGGSAAFVVFARGSPSRVEPPTGLLAAADHARTAFVAATAHLPQPGAGLLRGMAIGDRSGLDEATEAAMETTATTHLTAVSGSNCAVLVAVVVLVARGLGASRWLRAAVGIVVLLGFVTLVRPDPSIVRATIMAVVVLLVHCTGRPVRGLPLVAVAACGMLVADPWTARSFAFALSVLATAGIVVLAPPLTALLERRLWTPVAAAVAVPIAAQVACWPVTVLLAPEVPTYAVPVNLLAESLAPVATVVGLLACVLAPLWPAGASLTAGVAWVPAAGVAALAHGGAALPFSTLAWPDTTPGAIAAATVSGTAAAAMLLPHRCARRRLVTVAAGTFVLGIVVAGLPAFVARASVPRDWAIAACDVGQGDAVLVRDAGAVMLVDTGDDEELLTSCLDLLGVDEIDLLVLSHFDRDHVGAVDAVVGSVSTALVGPFGRDEDRRVTDSLTGGGAAVASVAAGSSGRLGGAPWRVLWPPVGTTRGGNEASVVLRIDAGPSGGLSAVLLGDLGEREQRRLRTSAPEAIDPGVDVVKVSHHGSADQDSALYDALGARVGLVGVGSDNTYGHPTKSALDMLRDARTTALRTDELGTVVLAPAPSGSDGPVVWTSRSPGASALGKRPLPAGPVLSDAQPRLVVGQQEGPHARQKAREGRRQDRPGAVVRHPPGARRARHRSRDVPGRTGHRHPP